MVANFDDFLASPLRVLALRDKDSKSLFRSASGGAFPVLARPVLQEGGVVFGAEMLPGGEVRHVGITDAGELPRIQGSKYVWSDTAGTYGECAEVLNTGSPVLFSGTPCQVFALRSYLANKGVGEGGMQNLLTVDLICHGVTSPELFELYIDWLEEKVGAVPGSLHYEFRSKKRGWGLYYYYYYMSKRDGRKHERFGQCEEDPYYMAFLEGQLYRPSCYKCRFARKERVGDFTIGDFWGIQREHPNFVCNEGASVVLINTPKGIRYFEKCCSDNCYSEDSTWEKASRENRNLCAPTRRNDGGAELARKVEEAVLRGDADTVFGGLLKRPRSLKMAAKRVLPYPLILFLRRLLKK